MQSGRCRSQCGTFRFCPCRGARCISAEILGCLPSPSAELTSASATGMLLSKSPVLPRWQKPWIIASSARDPGMKGPQRPRSSKGDGRDRLAEAWCECLLPLGGTVSQRMPAEPPSLLATLTNAIPAPLGRGPEAAQPMSQRVTVVLGSCPPPRMLPLRVRRGLVPGALPAIQAHGGEGPTAGRFLTLHPGLAVHLPSHSSLGELVFNICWVQTGAGDPRVWACSFGPY